MLPTFGMLATLVNTYGTIYIIAVLTICFNYFLRQKTNRQFGLTLSSNNSHDLRLSKCGR